MNEQSHSPVLSPAQVMNEQSDSPVCLLPGASQAVQRVAAQGRHDGVQRGEVLSGATLLKINK